MMVLKSVVVGRQEIQLGVDVLIRSYDLGLKLSNKSEQLLQAEEFSNTRKVPRKRKTDCGFYYISPPEQSFFLMQSTQKYSIKSFLIIIIIFFYYLKICF